MSTCEYCGAVRCDRGERWGLMVQSDPPAAFWRGVRLPLGPQELKIFFPLVVRGAVSHGYLEMAVCPDVDDARNQIAVKILHLRRKLAAAGVPHKIVSEMGWGYRLERSPD